MTNKEALKILEIIKEEYEDMPVFVPRLPALDFAIEALKDADENDHEYSYFPYQCRQQPEVNYEHLEHTCSERRNY